MNRLEFEELELKVQQSDLPLKSYLQQVGVSYSTYHYWRKKCSVVEIPEQKSSCPESLQKSTCTYARIPSFGCLLYPETSDLEALLLFGTVLRLQDCAGGGDGFASVSALVDDAAALQQSRPGRAGPGRSAGR